MKHNMHTVAHIVPGTFQTIGVWISLSILHVCIVIYTQTYIFIVAKFSLISNKEVIFSCPLKIS